MLEFNKSRMQREEIIEKPGTLATRIVMNSIFNNKLKLWLIGNTNCNALHIMMVKGVCGTVAFTEKNLIASYANRSGVKNILLKSFGKNIFVINMSLIYIQNLLNPITVNTLGLIIVNPNSNGFFVPIYTLNIKQLVETSKLDEFVGDNETWNTEPFLMTYDDKEEIYSFSDFGETLAESL